MRSSNAEALHITCLAVMSGIHLHHIENMVPNGFNSWTHVSIPRTGTTLPDHALVWSYPFLKTWLQTCSFREGVFTTRHFHADRCTDLQARTLANTMHG